MDRIEGGYHAGLIMQCDFELKRRAGNKRRYKCAVCGKWSAWTTAKRVVAPCQGEVLPVRTDAEILSIIADHCSGCEFHEASAIKRGGYCSKTSCRAGRRGLWLMLQRGTSDCPLGLWSNSRMDSLSTLSTSTSAEK